MIEAITKLENTQYQNNHKYTKGVSYNYGLELAIGIIKRNTDYDNLLEDMKKTLTVILTDVRFSDECYEGFTDALTIIKNHIKLHEDYMVMCQDEFKYDNRVDYGISNNTVYIWNEDVPKKELYDLIDEVRNIIKSYGFIVDSSYNFDFNRNEFKVIGMVI